MTEHEMLSSLPSGVLNDTNKGVLDYIKDLSAHDGVASELINALRPLGDVQVYCPDPASFRYVVAATNNIIFGIAHGMDTVAFRLDPVTREKALLSGCKEHPGLAGDWVWVNPQRGDWPAVDFKFWARKSYVYIRESSRTINTG